MVTQNFKPSQIIVLIAFFLLSLSENRLKAQNQETGYREQVTGSNQTTVYRLQATGSKTAELPLGEINQQVESTTNYELRVANCDDNQVTGNRLQGTGNRRQRTDNEKIALSIPEKPENPSFQIGQRVESTTNCQLPTANCDNGIRCHLMMDPSSTSSTLEEGMKALSRFVKPSVYPEEEGAISAAARIKPSTATSNSSSYAKYIVPEETSVAAYGDTERQGQGQIDNVTPETREFEAYFSNTIKRVRAEAEGISQEAEKAVSIAKEKANQSVASVKMWREVIDKATEAEGIYEVLVQYCTQ